MPANAQPTKHSDADPPTQRPLHKYYPQFNAAAVPQPAAWGKEERNQGSWPAECAGIVSAGTGSRPRRRPIPQGHTGILVLRGAGGRTEGRGGRGAGSKISPQRTQPPTKDRLSWMAAVVNKADWLLRAAKQPAQRWALKQLGYPLPVQVAPPALLALTCNLRCPLLRSVLCLPSVVDLLVNVCVCV